MTIVEFVKEVEEMILPLAEENSEGSYEEAKRQVAEMFEEDLFKLTDNQVVTLVNRVWDNLYKDREVIASWGICNTASLNVYEIEEDVLLVGINNNRPEKREIQYDLEGRPYIDWGGEYYLDECMRI